MAVGKNKRLTKGGKKGGKKKAGDPFLKKEWYDIKAPSVFSVRQCGKTLVTRTQGTKIASEQLKGRVLEMNLADLNNDEDQGYKKVRLCIEEVQGRNCLTDFHGLSLTRDKLNSLVRKWQTLIEANVDVKTTDGYVVRLFVIAFTKRRQDQVKTNCYARSAQIRKIRAKMVEIMTKEAGTVQLRELVKKLIPESIGKEIEKQTQAPHPDDAVHCRAGDAHWLGLGHEPAQPPRRGQGEGDHHRLRQLGLRDRQDRRPQRARP